MPLPPVPSVAVKELGSRVAPIEARDSAAFIGASIRIAAFTAGSDIVALSFEAAGNVAMNCCGLPGWFAIAAMYTILRKKALIIVA